MGKATSEVSLKGWVELSVRQLPLGKVPRHASRVVAGEPGS